MSDLIKREDVQREIQVSFDGGAFRWQDGQDLMDRINALPAAPRWHRVEDELPKKVGSYLTAYCDGFVCENEWHYIGPTAIGWVNDEEAVRYWMPLPEPPKEE